MPTRPKNYKERSQAGLTPWWRDSATMTTVATIALVVATIALAFVAYFQLRLTADSAAHTDANTGPQLVVSFAPDRIGTSANIVISNLGDGAAQHLRALCVVRVYGESPWMNVDDPKKALAIQANISGISERLARAPQRTPEPKRPPNSPATAQPTPGPTPTAVPTASNVLTSDLPRLSKGGPVQLLSANRCISSGKPAPIDLLYIFIEYFTSWNERKTEDWEFLQQEVSAKRSGWISVSSEDAAWRYRKQFDDFLGAHPVPGEAQNPNGALYNLR